MFRQKVAHLIDFSFLPVFESHWTWKNGAKLKKYIVARDWRVSKSGHCYLCWFHSHIVWHAELICRNMDTCLHLIASPTQGAQVDVVSHYSDVIMDTMASQITSLTIVYAMVYSGTDQRKHQSSASLAFVRGIHRSPVNSPHKWPVTRKLFPFDDVIMSSWTTRTCLSYIVNCWLPGDARSPVNSSHAIGYHSGMIKACTNLGLSITTSTRRSAFVRSGQHKLLDMANSWSEITNDIQIVSCLENIFALNHLCS